MTEPAPRTDQAALQFMIVDFLTEILNFAESPSSMGQYLTRQLRALLGVRIVVLFQHGGDLLTEASRIVAIEPERARRATLLTGLTRLAKARQGATECCLLDAATAAAEARQAMELLGIASLSMTPLRVGTQRVGTLFALDHLDTHRSEDVVRLLSALAPVFALIMRNALYFESQEAKVLSQAEEYSALLRTNLDGFLVADTDTRILDANQAYLDMIGYSLDELRSLTIAQVEAAESPAETGRHARQMAADGSDRFVTAHRRKDGSAFPVEISITYVPNRDLLIGFVRDLTKREAAESALRLSEAQHRELVEVLGEGVAMTDSGETIIMANREAARIFGIAPGELVGRNLGAFLEEAEWNRVATFSGRRRQGLTDSYQLQIRRPGGEHRTLQLTVTPRVREQGEFAGSLAVFRDITEDLRTQEVLRLAQKMESLGNLAGGVAHDMNNVLGAIMGLATTQLEAQPEGGDLQRTFDTINKACLRGRNMVKSLLDFARRDVAGERPVALNGLVREEVRLLERTIPSNIGIELELDPLAATLQGDPDALSLALMNLCVNAVDAMPDGGRLRIATGCPGPGQLSLTVADSGTGMPPETLERALEPFFTTKPQGKGTGLGLSLVYRTVKAHHGELDLASSPGQGTTVTLRFPAMAAASPDPDRAEPGPAGAAAALSVLLVDDDELIQTSIALLLKAMGHQVAVAATGEAAMEQIEAGLRPDLVLLDMNMPGWGGARTLPILRAALPDLPVILATGRADQQAIDLAHTHARLIILPKPFSFKELQTAFREILGT